MKSSWFQGFTRLYSSKEEPVTLGHEVQKYSVGQAHEAGCGGVCQVPKVQCGRFCFCNQAPKQRLSQDTVSHLWHFPLNACAVGYFGISHWM